MNTTTSENKLQPVPAAKTAYRVFAFLWVIVFFLYLPAINAGWVLDSAAWIKVVREIPLNNGAKLWDHLNITQYIPSLYQFTQLSAYLLYQVLGAHAWAWSLLFITMQAANATLIYTISQKLFTTSGVKHGTAISFGAVVLFCVCPHLSEVIVWKASFHYLQAMLMIFVILYWVQQFQYSPKTKYAVYSIIVYLCAAFSLELFYLTPWLALTLVVYYGKVLGSDSLIFKRSLQYFVLPLFLIFIGHIILLHAITGVYTAHLGNDIIQPLTNYLRKAPLYLFHILCFGRFFTYGVRSHVYTFFETASGLTFFYGSLACIWLIILLRYRRFAPADKVMVLLFVWLHFCLVIVSPVWFPDMFLVIYDRYTYILLPFIYLLCMLLLARLRVLPLAIAIFVAYMYCNVHLTRNENRFWQQSQNIVNGMVHTMPPAGDKTILMLNLPYCLKGIPMVASLPKSSFKVLYNINNKEQIDNKMYDVASYNMDDTGDGAHVMVTNDSTILVTLNQWGTWWWYATGGAYNYQNQDYKVKMSGGLGYELTLKHPSGSYMLLYNTGSRLKVVDFNKLNTEQY